MGLFLDGIFDPSYSSPNKVIIEVPLASGGGYQLAGLLSNEPAISSGNNWGTVISDVSTLSDISSIMGNSSIFTWIGASTQCWKGTNPLKLSIEMYLINYKKDLGLEDKIKGLIKLTSLSESDGNFKGKVSVVTHGGYQADVLSNNQDFFKNTKSWGDMKDIDSSGNTMYQIGAAYFGGKEETGTVRVNIGNRLKIFNLLVSRVSFVPSMVEVVDKIPLYYRLSIEFTGARPLLSTDVDAMFYG